MVNYGDTLLRARRPGWEDAYMDYQALRSILEQTEYDSDTTDINIFNTSNQWQSLFVQRLHQELEKVSLFVLGQQGEIAQAVGALRFRTVHEEEQGLIASRNDDKKPKYLPPNTTDALSNSDPSSWMQEQQEQTALLPSSAIGTLQTPLPRGRKKGPLFRNKNATNKTLDEARAYTMQGVELLHLLRFICVNAMGFRKILKKYQKVIKELGATRDHQHDPSSVPTTDTTLQNQDFQSLQRLANSNSVAVIHASLQAALTENTPAASSNKNKSPTKPEHSTATSPDWLRLQCTVSCIHVLRETADRMDETFKAFLSQKAMISTSGGLQQGTQQALELLLRFRPDALIKMKQHDLLVWQLRQSLRMGKQQHRGTRGDKMDDDDRMEEEYTDYSDSLDDNESVASVATEYEEDASSWGGVNSITATINLLSTLLYTINYYIVAPTANRYAILLGQDGAFGATLVGASSLTAIFAAFLYSLWYTRASFQSALVFSALCPCLGNMLYSLAISYNSMALALFGRILVGFGSAEVVNRQLISTCVSFRYMTTASAHFVAVGAAGMSIGPLLAAIFDMTSGRDTDVDLALPFMPSGGIIYNHVTSPGFFMSLLWMIELLALVVLFREPKRINASSSSKKKKSTRTELLLTEYGSAEVQGDPQPVAQTDSSLVRTIWREISTVWKLVFDNVALPITILLFGFIELVDEVLISSCAMVCKRYFGWHGSRAGLLLASLGALVIPAHYFVEKASHRYEERSIMKHSVVFIIISLFAILNYEGVMFDTIGVAISAVTPGRLENDEQQENPSTVNITIGGEDLTSFLNEHSEIPYDWGAGTYVYITFLSAIFMGTIILEGVDTSLMAKFTPSALNDTFINSGLLATLVGCLGRVIGDSTITLSALADKDVFTDFVNATFFPMIPMALVGYYLARRHYKCFISKDGGDAFD